VAKVTLVLGLFVLLPFAINTARLFAYGAPWTSMAASMVQLTVIGGAIIVPAWLLALALLSRSLVRFLAGAGAAVLVWYAAVTAVATFAPAWLLGSQAYGAVSSAFAPPFVDWQRVEARGWLFACTMTIAALAAVIGCYRSQRAWPSVAIGAALLTGLTLVPASTGSALPAAELAALLDGGLTLHGPLSVPMPEVRAELGRRTRAVPMVGTVVMRRPPPDTVTVGVEIRAAQLTGAGSPFAARGVPACCVDDGWVGAGVAVGAARPSYGLPGTPERALSPGRTGIFSGAPDAIDAIAGRTVDVEADVKVAFTRHRVVGTLPLRGGVAFRTDAYLLELLAVDPATGAISVRFARFPTLGPQGDLIRLFAHHGPDRRPIPVNAWLRQERWRGGGAIGWAYGRGWVIWTTLPLVGASYGDSTHLSIVESSPAGEVAATLVARDVPVSEAQDASFYGRRF
jgi:hypothetical protein